MISEDEKNTLLSFLKEMVGVIEEGDYKVRKTNININYGSYRGYDNEPMPGSEKHISMEFVLGKNNKNGGTTYV